MSVATRLHGLLRSLLALLAAALRRAGQPVAELAQLLLGDAYATLKPIVLFVAAYVHDFVAVVGEADAGWFKCAVSMCLFVPICVSVTAAAYAVCYYQFVMGNAVVDAPLFFRYDAAGAVAHVVAPLTASNAYTFELALHYPESEHNHALGLVMASLLVELPDANGTALTLLREPRPLMPRYRSPLLRTMATVASAGPLLMGLWHEETRMLHTLVSDWRPLDGAPERLAASRADLHVSVALDKPLQLYTSRLTVRPRLWGLSYLWVEWFYVTSFLFCWWMVFWQGVLYTALWLCVARCMVEELRIARRDDPLGRNAFLDSDEDRLEWDQLLREHREQREKRAARAAAAAAAAPAPKPTAASASRSTKDPLESVNDNDDDADDIPIAASPATSSAPLDFSSKGGVRRRQSRSQMMS